MDFFRAQESARKTSRWLVWWFALCVAGVVLAVHLLLTPLLWFVANHEHHAPPRLEWWNPQMLLSVTLVIGGTIVIGSLVKLAQLSAGGGVVARDLGGRQVDPSTSDPLERRLLNVVEEMAIASGLPVPGVWVLDNERAINAFAAGTDPANAVVGVTRGCLEQLTREELQGVVGHEFSHILNGDMRLNMRLAGWVFGLVMVSMVGRMLLETIRFVNAGSSRRDQGGGVGVILAIAVIGGLVWLAGSIGGFFARWLQAGVSRQREYLADASAVQFTRNPAGLSGALGKVGGLSLGGTLTSPAAAEARHFFFVRSDLLQFGFATHPPLERRIRAINPSWDGKMVRPKARQRIEPDFGAAFTGGGGGAHAVPDLPPPMPFSGFAPGTLGDSGRLDSAIGAAISGRLIDGGAVFRSKEDAKNLLHGLLLARTGREREGGLAILRQHGGDHAASRAEVWNEALHGWDSASKIALIDASLPWLKRMAADEAHDFIAINRRLIEADGQVSLFEFMLEKMIERHVAVGTGLRRPPEMRHRSLVALEREVAVLLGAFAGIANTAGADAQARAEYREHTGRELPRLPADACELAAVAGALGQIDASTPLVKSAVLRMCGLVVTADGQVDCLEIELLRAVAEAIGAPIPPFVRMRMTPAG
jgi:Zn-dependent protease with chaperone function